MYTATMTAKNVLEGQLSTSFVTKEGGTAKQYGSLFDFPNRGSSDSLYISRDDNSVYRWDEANSKYYCVGRDYSEIDTIICGGNA